MKTYYLDNLFLNAVLRQTPFSSPPLIYVGLFTIAPTASGGGTEVAGLNYVRQSVIFGPPVNGQTANISDVVYPVAGAAWGNVVAFGLFDAFAGGNLLYFNNLSVPRNVAINDQLRFAASQILCGEA
jgi:hypothetical protein